MNDQPTTPSGSRWEPQDDQPTEKHPVQPAEAADETHEAPATYAPAQPAGRRWAGRGALLLAGGALGLALVAGTAGFALGHATGGDERQEQVGQLGQVGPVGDDDGDGPGDWDHDGDGRGPGGPGFAPPGGTLPGQSEQGTTRPDDEDQDDDASGSLT